MKNKVLAGILMLAMTAGILAGCGKKEVDYTLDGDTEESTQQSVAEPVELNLAEYETVGTWADEWKLTDSDGYERPVKVDLEIMMPDIDKLSVIEVEELDMGERFRKQFVRAFFENGDIYNHEEPQYTRAELEEMIADLEVSLETADEDWWRERLETYIEEYEEQLETAPEEPVVADDYATCTEYTGFIGDAASSVSFRVEDRNIMAGAGINYKDFAPESLSGCEEVLLDDTYTTASGVENECKYSEEEALRIAETFLIKVGLSSQICVETNPVMWRGENNSAIYGYSFTFGTGVDGMVFNQFPDFIDFDLAARSNMELGDYDNGDSIKIIVTDDGVIDVYMIDAMSIRKVHDAATILPVEEIQGIFKEEVMEHPAKYDLTRAGVYNYKKFNRMELIYLKLPDETQEGVYNYTPVWCFSDCRDDELFRSHPVFVNAIDGSIVNVFDTQTWWEENE